MNLFYYFEPTIASPYSLELQYFDKFTFITPPQLETPIPA